MASGCAGPPAHDDGVQGAHDLDWETLRRRLPRRYRQRRRERRHADRREGPSGGSGGRVSRRPYPTRHITAVLSSAATTAVIPPAPTRPLSTSFTPGRLPPLRSRAHTPSSAAGRTASAVEIGESGRGREQEKYLYRKLHAQLHRERPPAARLLPPYPSASDMPRHSPLAPPPTPGSMCTANATSITSVASLCAPQGDRGGRGA